MLACPIILEIFFSAAVSIDILENADNSSHVTVNNRMPIATQR